MGRKKNLIHIKSTRHFRLRLRRDGQPESNQKKRERSIKPNAASKDSRGVSLKSFTIYSEECVTDCELPSSPADGSESDVMPKIDNSCFSDLSTGEIEDDMTSSAPSDDAYSTEIESWRMSGKSLDELLDEDPLSDVEENDEEDEFISASKTDLEEQFKKDLRNWHKKFAITNVALCALLSILRSHPCFLFLPKSDKTLLRTPDDLKYEDVEPGKYHHIGLENTLRKVLSYVKEKIVLFRLFVGIDGLPMFKSVPGEMWPILISFLGIPKLKTVICPIGLYYGPGKPASVSKYLEAFIHEASSLIKHGIDFNGLKVRVIICGFGCDAPAKSFILNTKGHTGFSSCTKCKAEGESYKNRMTFPPEKPIVMRTHKEFLTQSDSEYHKGETPLTQLPNIHFINSFPIDYLHLVCLGIVRTILYIWIFAKPPYKLPYRLIDAFSKNIEFLKLYVPHEFNRKGRTMNEIRRWKATEFRTLLLYTGIVALKDLEKDYPAVYLHFLSLHVIMRILLSAKPSRILWDYSQKLISTFLSQAVDIYGQQIATHNFHNLNHLPGNLDHFDNLEECSTFKFENCLNSLKKLKRKSAQVLQQCCLRLHEYLINDQWFHNAPQQDDPVPYKLLKEHHDGPVPIGTSVQQYKSLQMPQFKITPSTPDNCCLLEDTSIIIVRNIISSPDSGIPLIVGQKLRECENFYPQPLIDSTLLGIGVVSVLGPVECWSASAVSQKLILLPYKDKHVCIPLLHGDSD